MPSKELATICTYTLVLQIASTSEQTEVEGSGGGSNVGVLGQPLSLPPGLHAALPSHGEITPMPPTPAERKQLEMQSQPPPHQPQALPACVTVLGPGLLSNLDMVRGHRPLLLTVSAFLLWYPGSHLGQWSTHFNIFFLCYRPCREKAAELKVLHTELRHLETWAVGATDLELLNWMRSQHQMPPMVVGTFLVVLRILL